MCKCEEERQEAQRKEEERIKFRQDCERLRRDGITDPSYLVNTFAQDDNREPRRFGRVPEVRRPLGGNEGRQHRNPVLWRRRTGKSFLACCIANAPDRPLCEGQRDELPRIMNRLQGFGEDKQGFLDKLNRL